MIQRKGLRSQSTDLVTRVVEHIDHLISEGKVVPGQRLTEAEIARQLGIGRVPIREGLRILAGDGVLDLIPNRGVQIRKIGRREVFEMVRVLIALLQLACKEFTYSRSRAEHVPTLRQITRQIQNRIAKEDALGLLIQQEKYQATVISASGNHYLMDVFHRVHFSHYDRQVVELLPIPVLIQAARSYKIATECLARGDGDSAAAAFEFAGKQFLPTDD